MPKTPAKSKSLSKTVLKNYNSYPCRLCNTPHPLRKCRKFLAMNISDRINAVRDNSYCQNCLAHDHSNGKCFSKYGCKHCKRFHHTLLHLNPRLAKDLISSGLRSPSCSRSNSPEPSTSSKPRGSLTSQSKE